MRQDYLNALGQLALGSRLKRISERMLADAAAVYQHFGVDVQPKWFTLLALLSDKKEVSVVAASQMLGLSQPAVSQFAKQLQAKGYLAMNACAEDSRRKNLSLTELGQAQVDKMQPMWDSVHLAANELCEENHNDFYRSLLSLEAAFDKRSLLQRSLDKAAVQQDVSLVPFRPNLAHHFDQINRQWISAMFTLEAIDERVITQPQDNIIAGGGKIWFARHHQKGIVGTCALLKKAQGEFELTKMGVLESARGLKVGESLLRFVIEQSQRMNIHNLFLLTNKKCQSAIHLYEKHGFVHDEDIMQRFGGAYQRCDVAMRYRPEASDALTDR